MKRPASKIVLAAVVSGVLLIILTGVKVAMRSAAGDGGAGSDDVPCGDGFARQGTRCCPTNAPSPSPGLCAIGPPASCPPPLVATLHGCDAPERSVVEVPKTRVIIGPSDWEAEGRVRPRTVEAGPFAIDRFEVSVGHIRCPECPAAVAARQAGRDPGRAAAEITLFEARAICAARGGRLPTEDEWIVAAAGDRPRRYPWGDTGAVCRRAAWGLAKGPCGNGATGPDTVGSHPDGATPLGIHDLAGNVAEWVEVGTCGGTAAGPGSPPCTGVVRGGSFETDLATDLRTWVRREVPASSREPSIGFRCAYEPVVSPAPQ
ncbi:MAG TPA: SUMF1/EgtB/PvdO family nonheme iron enzyme [Labilithrix sp.]|nr:SUMF1/EgtB/PvdO family nonheme iron enzyme [Labilithrix sp.]